MVYRTIFEGSGIQHSNTGLQITNMYINGFFMLLSDLTPDRGASESHTSLPENGNIRMEFQLSRPLPESITCPLYLEYDSTVLIKFSHKSPPISNGHLADYLYSATRNFFPWCLPLSFITVITSYPETLYPHRQCRSPYSARFTLASHTSYTPLFECLVLRLIWHSPTSPSYPNFRTSKLHHLGI